MAFQVWAWPLLDKRSTNKKYVLGVTDSIYKLVTWYVGHVVLVINLIVFRSHLIFDSARALKMLLMNVLNSYCRSWKELRSCMVSFIDCLNHVYNLILNFYTVNSISTAFQQQINFSEFMRIAALIYINIWTLLEFMFKSLSRSINCMPLHYCDLQTQQCTFINEYALLSLNDEFSKLYMYRIL